MLLGLHLFLFGLAVLLAKLEIQVEGPHGWGSALPTWKIEAPVLRWFLQGKPLTGYHVYLLTFLFALFHFPALLRGWSGEMELLILAAFVTLLLYEDFLWFTLNPYFGWQRFSAQYVWWFPQWIGPFPKDYYAWTVVGMILIAIRGKYAVTEQWFPTMAPAYEHWLFWCLGLTLCAALMAVTARYFQPKAKLHAYSRDHADRPGTEGVNMLETV